MATNANGFWDPVAPAPKDPFAMTPAEHAALLLAPKRTDGTTVTVRGRTEPGFLPPFMRPADHMYEQYDDGRQQYIYRAGPDWPHSARIRAQATPASQNPDYGQGTRVIDQFFVPNVSARAAFAPAQHDAERVNASGRTYGIVQSNSNMVIGDHTQRQFGKRSGDARTWGYQHPPGPSPAGVDPVPPGVYRATNSIW